MTRLGSFPTTTVHRRALATITATFVALGAVAGSASASAPPAGDPDASVAIGFVLEPINLDILNQGGAPTVQVLLDNVYETLVKWSVEDGAVEPGLATLEVSDDALTYTFALQEGVTFSDGKPLTSADVAWSLRALGALGGLAVGGDTDGTAPAEPSGIEAEALAAITAIDTPDEGTVVLTLAQPDNDLAFNLARRAGAVLPEGASNLEASAIGTGPFVLTDWTQGSSITLERNDSYWGDAPQVAEVVFQYFTEPTAATTALEEGDVDLITGVAPDLLDPYLDNPDWVVTQSPTNGEVTLSFNNGNEVLSNPLVRQAITQALDRDGIIELNNGIGTPLGAPVPPLDPWYDPSFVDIYPYDLDAAAEKLAEAGYADGLELTFIVPNIYPTTVPDYIVSQLAEIGITVDLQVVEFPTWFEQVYENKDYDMSYVIHVEPRDLGNYANPDYYFQYDNADVQRLIADAKTAATPEEQIDLLHQASAIIAEDVPAFWTLFTDVIVASPDVTGYPTVDVQSRFDASDLVVTSE